MVAKGNLAMGDDMRGGGWAPGWMGNRGGGRETTEGGIGNMGE